MDIFAHFRSVDFEDGPDSSGSLGQKTGIDRDDERCAEKKRRKCFRARDCFQNLRNKTRLIWRVLEPAWQFKKMPNVLEVLEILNFGNPEKWENLQEKQRHPSHRRQPRLRNTRRSSRCRFQKKIGFWVFSELVKNLLEISCYLAFSTLLQKPYAWFCSFYTTFQNSCCCKSTCSTKCVDLQSSLANKRDYVGLPDRTNAVCAHGGRHLYGLTREPSRRMHRYQCGWQKQVRKLGKTEKFITFGNMTFDTACQGEHRRRGNICQVVISLPAKKEKELQEWKSIKIIILKQIYLYA